MEGPGARAAKPRRDRANPETTTCLVPGNKGPWKPDRQPEKEERREEQTESTTGCDPDEKKLESSFQTQFDYRSSSEAPEEKTEARRSYRAHPGHL